MDMDIQENNGSNKFLDILNIYILDFEAYSYYIFYSLSNVTNNTYNTSFYQHLFILIFIALVIFIIIVMYNDIIYRDASKIKRCKDIENATLINDNLEYPYKYNIYVINKNITDKSLSNFSFCLQYDFISNTTNVIFGEKDNINSITFSLNDELENDDNLSPAFVYYNLSKSNFSYIKYIDSSNKTFYINKNLITNPKEYLFIITRYDNKIVGNDKAAYELLKFVKFGGYDKNSVNLSAIYNILYSIDNKKNSVIM